MGITPYRSGFRLPIVSEMKKLLSFGPIIAFPLTFLLVVFAPWVISWAIIITIVGLLVAYIIHTVKGESTSRYSGPVQRQDDSNKIVSEYRHRNAQDGKY